MEKYEDHFNIDVLVAVTNCTSIVGVYTVVIDHFFPKHRHVLIQLYRLAQECTWKNMEIILTLVFL